MLQRICTNQNILNTYWPGGATLAEDSICELTDDSGDNISKRNPLFCELTAGYWIWKNDAANEYVGLYHYSRGLDVSDEEIERIVQNGFDVLLPVPTIRRYELITKHPAMISRVILKAIKNCSPEYLDSANRFFHHRLMWYCNIVFCRKRIWRQYYAWMFDVLYECEKIVNQSDDIEVIPRLWGYIGEYLTGIFFWHHMEKLKTVYASIKLMY